MKDIFKLWNRYLKEDTLSDYEQGDRLTLYHYSRADSDRLILDPEHFLSGRNSFSKREYKKVVENDGWAYCDVLWFNDDKYETAMADRKKLTNKDWSLQRYRSDQLKLINIETELNTLEGIRHHLNNWSDTHDKPDS